MRGAGATGGSPRGRRGSVLIIVMWICTGLLALILYFANTVNSELQAAANQVGDLEARAAVDAGTRYAAHVLNTYAVDGVIPDSGVAPDPVQSYLSAALQVGGNPGDPKFWFIGRDVNNPAGTEPVFSLVDESSKLSLNSASAPMLAALPMDQMTSQFASAIVAWRTPQSQSGSGTGGVNNMYATLEPPRLNKGAPFESVDELRLVYGATLDLLLGEDTNRNGALDPNENDGDASPPHDNQDGVLQPGLFEYVTAFSAQPTTIHGGGGQRVNVTAFTAAAVSGLTGTATAGGVWGPLQRLLRRKGLGGSFPTVQRNIIRFLGTHSSINSVAAFMAASRMSAANFAQIHTSLTAGGSASAGLVNVNTAGETVLACIPGIGASTAASLVSYRLANPTALTSMCWIQSVLSQAAIIRAGPYITDQSYRFSADIAAVGRNGRGYHREKVVFDTSGPTPRVIYRQDLTACGWALGSAVRQSLKTTGALN